jgi:hypothetical protein
MTLKNIVISSIIAAIISVFLLSIIRAKSINIQMDNIIGLEYSL